MQAALVRFGRAPSAKAARAVGDWLLAVCTEYRGREVQGVLVAKAVFASEQNLQPLRMRVRRLAAKLGFKGGASVRPLKTPSRWRLSPRRGSVSMEGVSFEVPKEHVA